MLEVFRHAGFAIAAEAFADRLYEPDGTLRAVSTTTRLSAIQPKQGSKPSASPHAAQSSLAAEKKFQSTRKPSASTATLPAPAKLPPPSPKPFVRPAFRSSRYDRRAFVTRTRLS